MNRILAFSVITAVTAIMGLSAVGPAIADHDGIVGICDPLFEIWDPNTISCIPKDSCPNGTTTGDPTSRAVHCLLDTVINDNNTSSSRD